VPAGSAAELLRLTPLVWRHRPGLPAPDGNDLGYRRELFDALTGLLHAAEEQRTVVCVLEDLHWAASAWLSQGSFAMPRPGRPSVRSTYGCRA
jgi:hypothetical protein